MQGARRPASPVIDQPAHDVPLADQQDAAASLNGLSPRQGNPRRGFELMKNRARDAPPLFRIGAECAGALAQR
jgi:hypothetical protein